VSGQLHALAANLLPEKESLRPTGLEAEWAPESVWNIHPCEFPVYNLGWVSTKQNHHSQNSSVHFELSVIWGINETSGFLCKIHSVSIFSQ